MSFTAAQREAGLSGLADLEKQRAGAYFEVAGTWSASSSAKDAALAYFRDTVPRYLDSLRRRLDDGKGTWSAWVAECSALHRDMTEVLGYTSDWSLTDVLLATAGATGEELAETVSDVRAGAGIGAGAFVFVVLGFLAWKVLR